MKQRTTIYIDKDIHDYIRKNNINLSEFLALSIQNGQKNLSNLKKNFGKIQKNLLNLQETSQNLQKTIQKESQNLKNFYFQLSNEQKNYLKKTKIGVQDSQYSIIGRYKHYVKTYGEVDFGRFSDIIDHLEMLEE